MLTIFYLKEDLGEGWTSMASLHSFGGGWGGWKLYWRVTDLKFKKRKIPCKIKTMEEYYRWSFVFHCFAKLDCHYLLPLYQLTIFTSKKRFAQVLCSLYVNHSVLHSFYLPKKYMEYFKSPPNCDVYAVMNTFDFQDRFYKCKMIDGDIWINKILAILISNGSSNQWGKFSQG